MTGAAGVGACAQGHERGRQPASWPWSPSTASRRRRRARAHRPSPTATSTAVAAAPCHTVDHRDRNRPTVTKAACSEASEATASRLLYVGHHPVSVSFALLITQGCTNSDTSPGGRSPRRSAYTPAAPL
ncbi:MAG: hypothetical protein EA387_16060 [Nitriliruptor sp.]|nr:MAG: hypothetical protein EA387_16060 [Nitriliruptor sp.]